MPRYGLYKHGPPDGGLGRRVTASINMALLTEGWGDALRLYKHGPPDGGLGRRVTASINTALLTEGGGAASRPL